MVYVSPAVASATKMSRNRTMTREMATQTSMPAVDIATQTVDIATQTSVMQISDKAPVEFPTPARRGADDNTPIKELGFCGPAPPKRSPPAPPPFLCRCGGGLLDEPGGNPVRYVNGKLVQVFKMD